MPPARSPPAPRGPGASASYFPPNLTCREEPLVASPSSRTCAPERQPGNPESLPRDLRLCSRETWLGLPASARAGVTEGQPLGVALGQGGIWPVERAEGGVGVNRGAVETVHWAAASGPSLVISVFIPSRVPPGSWPRPPFPNCGRKCACLTE